jgi:hypothetical protein
VIRPCSPNLARIRSMATKKRPRKHTVKASVSNIDLTRAGTSISLEVFADKEKLGTVELGRGSIRWYGRNKQIPILIPWSRFSAWMDAE